MKKIFDFFKKYWLFILLSTIVVILLALRLSQKGVPSKPEEAPTPIFGTLPGPKSRFGEMLGKELTYRILLSESDFAKIPKTLPVYKIKKFSKEEVLAYYSRTIAGLGFRETPQEEQRTDGFYFVWREGENYLRVNINSGQFSFVGKAPLAQGEIKNPEQIKLLVEETLNSWNLIPGLKSKKIEGFIPVRMELSPISDLNKATFFKVFFEQTFDGFPIVGIGPAKNHIEATIDNQGTLVSLFFNLHQVDREIVDSYPTKSFTETIKEIEEGKGQIIQSLIKEEEASIPVKEQIQEVQISNLEIVYYETIEDQDFYQPVFLLTGKIILKNKEEYQALFILSAITEKYLAP